MCFTWLKEIALTYGPQAGFSPLSQALRVAWSYQFGVLVLPTLAPVALWIALDRRFLSTMVIEAALENAPARASLAGFRTAAALAEDPRLAHGAEPVQPTSQANCGRATTGYHTAIGARCMVMRSAAAGRLRDGVISSAAKSSATMICSTGRSRCCQAARCCCGRLAR